MVSPGGAYTQLSAAGPLKPDQHHLYETPARSNIAMNHAAASAQAMMVPHLNPTYMLAGIIVTALMYVGLYVCIKRRRSSKQWLGRAMFRQEPHLEGSMHTVPLLSWSTKPLVVGYGQRHWLDYKTISENIDATDHNPYMGARWCAPKSSATSPRRPRRRYLYPYGAYGAPARRFDHKTSSGPVREKSREDSDPDAGWPEPRTVSGLTVVCRDPDEIVVAEGCSRWF